MPPPEQEARQAIDAALADAGWQVQDAAATNLGAASGVAVREFRMASGQGTADYVLFVDRKAVGVIEAKKRESTLTGVEIQARLYSEGLPSQIPAPVRPLPFVFVSNGVQILFENRLDPEARSRSLFGFPPPHALARWLVAPPLPLEVTDPRAGLPGTLRGRLQQMPPLEGDNLWSAQRKAVEKLERSLAANRPRALIQMATGSGKTVTAITSAYRLLRYAGAERILFLVDRNNLGTQMKQEFQRYVVPGDGRKLTELYNVQHLQSNRIDPVARVVISTIQRLYSILRGDPELDPSLEEGSLFDSAASLVREPVPVVYNRGLPPTAFDVVFIDECHRSIYTTWGQVVEYFDAFLIGMTATPSKQTFGFFHKNLVMEYSHPQAVADRVNVPYEIYRIRTRITEEGSKVEAGYSVERRDRRTGAKRWETLDEELAYVAGDLDRSVVAPDQIRTIARTFREKLPTEIFPGRTDVPKTLIYAKDDRHADDIVGIFREEFERGGEFVQKITYRTTGKDPKTLLQEFRTSYYPRIAVTVDMVATGTDIRPLEVVMFLRSVKSRNFYEQMKGRGVRIVSETELRSVTPGEVTKDHFVLVDCVGVTEEVLAESYSLERKRSVPLGDLLNLVAFGNTEVDVVASLASRLTRLARRVRTSDLVRVFEASKGVPLAELAGDLARSVAPEVAEEAARAGLPAGAEPSTEAVEQAAEQLRRAALEPLATNAPLRQELLAILTRFDQTVDVVSVDQVREAGFSQEVFDQAWTTTAAFAQYLEDHKDEITALQILYSRPHGKRLTLGDIEALAAAIAAPPRAWTPEKLWHAYEILGKHQVRGASAQRLLTDIVSLVRYTLLQEQELIPFRDRVDQRFRGWLAQQETAGRRFSTEQLEWLGMMKEQIAESLTLEAEDFDLAPFAQKGGAYRARQVFGEDLPSVLDELYEALAA